MVSSLKRGVLEQFPTMGFLVKHTVRTQDTLILVNHGGRRVANGNTGGVFRGNQVIMLRYLLIQENGRII